MVLVETFDGERREFDDLDSALRWCWSKGPENIGSVYDTEKQTYYMLREDFWKS